MIKAILLDIDGTLTTSEKEISPKTKEALLKAQASGIRLAVVSARTENGLARFGRWLDFENNHGMLIACNGALIKDMQTGECLSDVCMPLEVSTAILKELANYEGLIPLVTYGRHIYTNDVFAGMLHLTEPDGSTRDFDVIAYEARSNEYLLCEEDNLAAFFADKPVSKILVSGQPEYLEKAAPLFSAPFKETSANLFTAPYFYEFNPKGINKADAIKQAFAELGIGFDEMMAFGDQQNDIPMLESVKYGIAMGNATDACKAAAFDVTDDNDHDGIAKALYKYLPELFGEHE